MNYVRLFFKIMYKNIHYFIISFAILIIMLLMVGASYNKNIKTYKPTLYILDNDNTTLTTSIKNHLTKYAKLYDKTIDEDKVKEYLVNGKIDYYIKIDKGFTDKFLNKEEVYIYKSGMNNAISTVYLEQNINSYLNNINTYLVNSKSEALFYNYLTLDNKILNYSTSGIVDENVDNNLSKLNNGFTFLAYTSLYTLIGIVSIFFLSINKVDLKNRCLITPTKKSDIIKGSFIGNILFMYIYIILVVFVTVLIIKVEYTNRLLLLFLNLNIFSILCIAIGLLVSIFVKKSSTVNAASNVISLILSFLGGILVPMNLFFDGLVKLSLFTPTYWYKNTVDLITTTGVINNSKIFYNMGVIALFSIVIFSFTVVINKYKKS